MLPVGRLRALFSVAGLTGVLHNLANRFNHQRRLIQLDPMPAVFDNRQDALRREPGELRLPVQPCLVEVLLLLGTQRTPGRIFVAVRNENLERRVFQPGWGGADLVCTLLVGRKLGGQGGIRLGAVITRSGHWSHFGQKPLHDPLQLGQKVEQAGQAHEA